MHSTDLMGDWRLVREAVLQCWPRLTALDIEGIQGERRALVRVLKAHYGTTFGEIERQVRDFELRDVRAASMARPSLGITND
jgi:hypothetical protein